MAIRQSLTAIPERPRCKQSVAQHCSNLNRLNGTRLWPGSMAESSHRMPEGCCWGGWDRGLGLIRRMASCFTDRRDPRLLEHTVETLVGQRVFALALGYEDLNDHDELRHDPLFHVLAGKLEAKRSDCAPVAGKSTLNRLEHRPRREAGKYHKIDYDAPSLEALFVDIFLDGHKRAPKEIVLDLDATDDTIHGEQEGRFFHGYYDSYCYLPLYIFCGRFLLGAKLRPANIDGAAGAVDEVARIVARIRARWPKVRIVLRGDSGFCREELMAWCEAEGVAYLFGPGAQRAPEGGAGARGLGGSAVVPNHRQGGSAVQGFRLPDTRPPGADTAADCGQGRAPARRCRSAFRGDVSPPAGEKIDARGLYEDLYCARRRRLKSASRNASSPTSPTAGPRRQCRPPSCGSGSTSIAYVAGTASCAGARSDLDPVCRCHLRSRPSPLKLLPQIGALVRRSVRRIKFAMAVAGFPWHTRGRTRLPLSATRLPAKVEPDRPRPIQAPAKRHVPASSLQRS